MINFENCHYTEKSVIVCLITECRMINITYILTYKPIHSPLSLITLIHPHIFSLSTGLWKPPLITSKCCLCASLVLSAPSDRNQTLLYDNVIRKVYSSRNTYFDFHHTTTKCLLKKHWLLYLFVINYMCRSRHPAKSFYKRFIVWQFIRNRRKWFVNLAHLKKTTWVAVSPNSLVA